MRNALSSVGSVFFVLISAASVAVATEKPESFQLTCTFNQTKYHSFTFRLVGIYTPTAEGNATLSGYKGVLIEEPDLHFLGMFEGSGDKETLTSDPTYKPRAGDRWEGHVRFYLKPTNENFSSAPDQQFILAHQPTNCKTKRWDNRVNTGTDKTCDFHAGLNYHFSDQDGNRTEIRCTGVHTKIDRRN